MGVFVSMRSKRNRPVARSHDGARGPLTCAFTAVLELPSRWKTFRLLSFIGFFATLIIYSPNVMVVQGVDGGGLTGYFAEPCLLCAFVSALLIAAGSFGRKSFLVSLENPLVIKGILCAYAVGTCGFALTVYLQPTWGFIVNTVCAVIAGCSVIPACIIWAHAFEDMNLLSAVRTMAVAGGVSAVVNHVASQQPATITLAGFLALLGIGIVFPCVRNRLGYCQRRADECPVESIQPRVDIKAYFSVMAMPLIGMAISSFAMGVQPVYLFNGSVDAQRVGMVIGAAVLLVAAACARQPVYSFIYQAVIPIAAAAVLVLCVAFSRAVAFDVALASVYAFYSMVSGVAVAAALAIANAREFPRSFVLATLLGVFCAMGLLGIFMGARSTFLYDNNAAVLVMLTAVYGTVTMLYGCIKSWKLTVAPAVDVIAPTECPDTETPTVASFDESFDKKVARIALQMGLSPRETQIIGYIGRGHSSVYVAKTLLISESTVYSHVRNIYRKLDVSSREELIQLLNGL